MTGAPRERLDLAALELLLAARISTDKAYLWQREGKILVTNTKKKPIGSKCIAVFRRETILSGLTQTEWNRLSRKIENSIKETKPCQKTLPLSPAMKPTNY